MGAGEMSVTWGICLAPVKNSGSQVPTATIAVGSEESGTSGLGMEQPRARPAGQGSPH